MKRTLLTMVAILAISIGSYAQWIEQNTGFATASRGIQYISIVNPNVVWATAYDGSGGAATITDFTRTTNGGTTWTPGHVMTGSTYGLGNISAIDANTAWVTLFNATAGGDANTGIYKTTDGGTTWTHQAVALIGSAAFADNVYFWNANEGMCHGDVNGGYFEIYTTSDGGTTWTRVPQADINATVASGEGGWTTVIDAAGDSSVYFGSNKGKLYISNDRGHHWVGKATGITPLTNGGVQHIAFVDPLHGYVAQDKAPGATNDTTLSIYGTSDGGTTWAPVTTTGWVFANTLTAVKHTTSTYVTTGANGTPYIDGASYSFDGHAFLEFPNTLGNQFLYASFLNDSTGWSGHFNTDATNGGIWKFTGVLAAPVANFVASDTAVPLSSAQIHFTSLSTGHPASYAWTFTGGTPSSSTLQTPPAVTYNAPGSYNVSLTVTNDYGTSTKTKNGYIYVGGVGINEHSNAVVTIFPNPVAASMNINANSNIREVQVYNLVGQVVLSQTIGSKSATLNTSNLTSGIYNVKVVLNDGAINQKIVVK